MNLEKEACAKNNESYTLTNAEQMSDTQIPAVSTDLREVTLNSDFLFQYRHTKLNQIYFTQPGFFEKFQTALNHDPTYCWTDGDREEFLRVWPNIESAFQKSYENALSITAADALVILLENFTFDQIATMDTWVLARLFQAYWKPLCQLSFPDTFAVDAKRPAGMLQTA